MKQALPKCSIDHDIIVKYASSWSETVNGLKCRLGAQEIVWQTGVWASGKTGKQLELKPGKHIIRALYRPNPDVNEVSLVRRSLEIEILPEKSAVRVEMKKFILS